MEALGRGLQRMVGRSRVARTVLTTVWAAAVVIAMVLMSEGLWATVNFEPTADAIAEERRGHVFITVASLLLVGSAAFAYYVLVTPLVTPLGILAAVAVCVAVTFTSAVAVFSLLVAYPLVLGALAGALAAPRSPGPWSLGDQPDDRRRRAPGDED